MRNFLALACLFFATQIYAQFDVFRPEGVPTIPVVRHKCIQHEDATFDARIMQRTAAVQEKAPLAAKGSPKIVVCLANYADVKFTVAPNDEELKKLFDTFFNGKNVGVGDNPNSVADYFKAMSNGVFEPEFVITEPISISKERKYYGEVSGSNKRLTFRNEALDSLAVQLNDRLTELDTNEDGKIDGVVIVFPGAGANVGDNDGMHPACWTSSYTTNGITYATELVAPELLGTGQNAKLNGIGVFVHEISHMLGLPDFYDLNYKAPGMDYWSVMDYGEYWYNGYHPTPYTAYERNYMGWLPLVELSQPTTVSGMKTIAEGGSAYVIYNDGNRDEYYVLENRSVNDPWSRTLCQSLGSGMMIYHVDYNANSWAVNRVNVDAAHQRMTIVPANGHFELCDNFAADTDKYLSELRGHLWPLKNVESVLAYWGLAGNNELTDEERTEGDRVAPAARLHTPNVDGTYLMHKPITDIVYDSQTNTVSFAFMGGEETDVEDVVIGNNYTGDAMLKVYGIDGRMVAMTTESGLKTLPRGVYVVTNTKTGKTSKVINDYR